jgi:hypothetical protein
MEGVTDLNILFQYEVREGWQHRYFIAIVSESAVMADKEEPYTKCL